MAHKVAVFAAGAGEAIEGEVYFHGGAPARHVKVTLFGPGEQMAGETTTDEEGQFRFPIRFRCDYRLVADAGEGHGAEYTVPADELPDSLPLAGSAEAARGPAVIRPLSLGEGRGADASSPPPGRQAASQTQPIAAGGEGTPPATSNNVALRGEIEALTKQLAALRKDLNQWENTLRVRDVLGGLGYILGLMGLAFYFLGVRRKEKRAAERPPDA